MPLNALDYSDILVFLKQERKITSSYRQKELTDKLDKLINKIENILTGMQEEDE